ncbi:hypothetical protein AQ490_19735 [Wenjunlia vitaminophila]|uniref:Uncharacterized protein n=1 Tax=Wenjunlia vitaminophila TaxID=76728 RepID=A0A0T6LTS3_WENVI|nr:hypothetical protein [Wenjunlia vitaminophila]KRV49559.1 hypothetical protein AQ490_19735 [Wenjunlia vitaminophila]
MTASTGRGGTTRRAALAKKRLSRRPSRLGTSAGTAPAPDQALDRYAGFPGLLRQVWQRATAADDLPTAVDTLLTLGGHVPADVQLRALRAADEAALKVLCGVSWRDDDGSPDGPEPPATPDRPGGEPPAFLGELGLTTSGRIVVRVPSQGPLASEEDLVDGVMRVPWSARALLDYQTEVSRAATRFARSVVDCRQWLAAAGSQSRDNLLEQLKEAAQRTAPFILYQEGKQYTNFRDRNTITGKTLWPGHPDCALSSLQKMPLELWSDQDVVMVVCLTLLVRSAGFARIEEANGTQLTLDHVAYLLEGTRRTYNGVPGGQQVPAATSTGVEALDQLAGRLLARRTEVLGTAQLYREIHGALMHKIERVAGRPGDAARMRERAVCDHLRERLPLDGATLDELEAELAASPSWLGEPLGDFGTGLEALVHATVAAARTAFDADFAMSRGLRSLPRLIRALREQDWEDLVQWDLPDYFCCVVPDPRARRYFEDSAARLADMAWAMSSRMQYNSWHFLAGNVPKVPVVRARDYFVPPTIPDIAFHSDQHHHGHVAAKVRFSIRSPQAVEVLGQPFNGFMDLRLLRCAGRPFDEQDMLAAHRCSGFVARATSLVASLAADGADIEITSFDSQWHWEQVAGGTGTADGAGEPARRVS